MRSDLGNATHIFNIPDHTQCTMRLQYAVYLLERIHVREPVKALTEMYLALALNPIVVGVVYAHVELQASFIRSASPTGYERLHEHVHMMIVPGHRVGISDRVRRRRRQCSPHLSNSNRVDTRIL